MIAWLLRRKRVGEAACWLVGFFGVGCGAGRTELLPDREPCGPTQRERVCRNPCGEGNQACEAGFWQPCIVAPATSTCTGSCGNGSKTCEDGRWGACIVAETTRSCSNACGAGAERCSNDHWGACEVPPVDRACSNACGAGVETCQDGAWGACTVPAAVASCTGACGAGVQRCSGDRWGACEVPPVDRACSNTCGAGVETCRDGVWGACTVPVGVESCASVCGTGKKVCQNNAWGACDAPAPKAARLITTLRDFHKTHPDFERPISGDASDLGLVGPLLGSDDTPTYAHTGGTLTVTGPETFAQWYHDVPGVNVSIPYDVQLQASTSKPGFFVYTSVDFFPLDGDPRAFGNEGFTHDFDFTLATKFTFHYMGGEVFRFTGDDDLWVFVNRHLAIDLGGLHQSKTGEVYMDQHASEFGITPGNTYDLHLFFAERHVINSDFSVETTIADPGTCE